MGARLIGHDVGLEALPEQLRQDLRGVRAQPDAERAALALRAHAALHRVGEVVRLLVEVARLDAAPDAVALDLHAEHHALVHRDRERLRSAHAAEAGRQRDRPRERPAEAAARDLGEALVGALHDALAADVDPGARRHLPVHRQPERLEPPELVPVRPLADEVGVRDQHARRPFVGAEHADRLARLDEHRLVVAERAERVDDRVEGLPRARRLARAAVDHELVRPLRHVRVEVVHQHPERRLLLPAAAGELAAARRVHGAGAHSRLPTAASTASHHGARLDERRRARELRREPAVGARPRRRGPHGRARRRRSGRGLERRAEVERPRRAGELDGEDAAEVRDHGAELASGAPAHRHVVLLHRARGQRVRARRHREAPVLGDHRRLRVLREHQAGVHARRPRSGTAAARTSGSGRASGRCAARRSRRPRPRRSRGSRRPSPPARRGSCRTTPRGRRAARPGCRSRSAAPRARPRSRVRPACRAPRRSPAARSGASRRPARAGRRGGGSRRSPSRPAGA